MCNKLHRCLFFSISLLRGAGHAEVPCSLPRNPYRFLLTCGVRLDMGVENKKAVNETPVEEPALVAEATPFGVGISLTALLASASTPS